jgi:hypothetical protein
MYLLKIFTTFFGGNYGIEKAGVPDEGNPTIA